MSPGKLMGEYNEQSKQPNLYEQVASEWRFARTAEAFIDNSGVLPTADRPYIKTAEWPVVPDGYSYHVHEIIRDNAKNQTKTYMLDQYDHGVSTDTPVRRYTMTTNGIFATEVIVLNAQNQPIFTDPKTQQGYMRDLLTILAEIAPRESREALNYTFDSRFETAIGRYILSDLAIADAVEQEVSEYAAWVASEDFSESIEIIENEVRKWSKSRKQKLSRHHKSFIEEAITTRREPTSKNRYKAIDIEQCATRVAKEIGDHWEHTVTPER